MPEAEVDSCLAPASSGSTAAQADEAELARRPRGRRLAAVASGQARGSGAGGGRSRLSASTTCDSNQPRYS